MRKTFKYLIAVVLLLSFCASDGIAQRRKKRSRRAKKPVAARPVITNPRITPPTTGENASTGDVKVISTADQTNADGQETSDSNQTKKPRPNTTQSSDSDSMQQTITNLSNQVNRLNDRLSQMQDDDRYMLDMERLTRAEQRSEQLRSQLIDVQSKIADLEARLEQIEYMLKPENIDKATQGYGTVHPEDVRDARKRQLEGEKSRVQAQLNILETSKSRLETAIATADSEVDLLRAKLNQQRDQMNANPRSDSRPANPRKPE